MKQRSFAVSLGAWVGGYLLAGGLHGAVHDYPGGVPGPLHIAVSGSDIVLSNRVLAARWRVNETGVSRVSVSDLQCGRTLPLTGGVFQVVLADGRRFDASALRPASAPVVSGMSPEPRSARLAARRPGRQVEVPLQAADDTLRFVWRVSARDDSAYFREELEVVSPTTDLTIREVRWLEQRIDEARRIGRVDGSPIVAGSFYFGYEDPMANNQAGSANYELAADLGTDPTLKLPAGRAVESFGQVRLTTHDGPVVCRLVRDATLRKGERLTQSCVLGVVPEGQLRRGFLHYVEQERAHPYRPFLHYNSWYDIAWHPFALNETNCLDAIRTTGERFIRAHGVSVDAMVFDDGWDDPRTMWQFHGGFPRGFTPLAGLCEQYGTRLGVWLSPFGGYGEPKEQRLRYGHAQGYETNAAGFSLAGPRYYGAFKQACLDMIRRYGVNHFKFDGIASGMYADGAGADYILDTEAMRRLMLELRAADPGVYINLTTGSWPSPFWLRYADSLWRQGGDMGHAGKGTRQQQWLTYRDQEVYRNVVGKGPLFPLNALMTQGVAYSREGTAGDPTFDSAGFKDDVHAFFGAGTSLQELYIQPSRLAPADWAVLAEAARWSRANSDVLADTHWIGGDPSRLEVHGYASWVPRKGIIMLRNPDDHPHGFALDVRAVFELPAEAPGQFRLSSPWVEDRRPPDFTAVAGTPLGIELAPFQVLILDAIPIPPTR